MKETRINLDTVISKYIHRPVVKQGKLSLPPLYARVGSESETNFDAEGMRDIAWQNTVKHTYNSPTNVRRLFIGEHSVTIQYYQSPIRKDKSGSGCWETYTYEEEDNIGQLAQRLIDGERIYFTGTGLAALSRHWTMSNVEEIYITPAILLSEAMNGRVDGGKQRYINMINIQGKMAADNNPQAIFEFANGSNVKNIRNRFPRLKTVAFATNLDMMLSLSGAKNIRDGLPASLSDLGVNWYKHIWNLGGGECGSIAISTIPFEDNKPCLEFAVRPGIYRFDAEIIQDFAAQYKERALELARQNRDSKDSEPVVESNSVKSEYELLLEKLLAENGEEKFRMAMTLTFMRSPQQEIDETFNAMSDEGRQKFRPWIGR